MPAYERLDSQQRIFLDLEDASTPMHVAGVSLFEAGPLTRPAGGIDFERICDYVEARLYRIPRYRQRLDVVPVEGHPIWVDDESFNIRYHVRHTRLPLPGDERQLKRLAGRVVSQQLDRGKPLWELWVVEGLEHDRLALIAKLHHCTIDGVSGFDLLRALLTQTPRKTFDAAPTWLPAARPEPRTLLRDSLRRRLAAPFALSGALLGAAREPRRSAEQVRDVLAGLREARRLQARPAAETPLNRPIGPHRRFDWLAFDLEEVGRVAKSLGGGEGEVALATVSGALGRFLGQRGITPREQEELDLRVGYALSEPPGSGRGKLGGEVAFGITALPSGESDPRRRFERVRESLREFEDSKQLLVLQTLAGAGAWTSPTLLTAFARRILETRAANLTVTHVPGPDSRRHLLGAPLMETYPSAPLMPGQALGISIFRYGGGLFWGFSADWEAVPDLHDFVVAVDASFRELCEAADPAARRRRRRARPPTDEPGKS